MREVETVQPLASLPTSGRTPQSTPQTTWVQRLNIPAGNLTVTAIRDNVHKPQR
jgi:hypothetical protein